MGSVDFDRSTGTPATVPQDRISFRKITGNFAELYVGSNSNVPIKVTDSGKQPTLVSGTNIKTVDGSSLLGSGNIPITSGLVSRLTCAMPLKNVDNQGFPTYHAMTMGGTNTLAGSVNGSGYYVVPTTGVYDIYVEGRPNIRNEGSVYGVFEYRVQNHTTGLQIVAEEKNWPINGIIGLWCKVVGMGIPLTAGHQIKLGFSMYMNSPAGGHVASHNVDVAIISR